MAGTSKLELAVDTGKWDAGLKKGKQSLDNFIKDQGGLQNAMTKSSDKLSEFVRILGRSETTNKTVTGRVKELKNAYTELRAQYNRLTAEEKRGDFGKALNKSLEQLRARTIEAKSELNGISKELSGNMSGALSDIAGKFGISSDLMGVLTTGTMAYTAAITAAAAAVAEAAKAWAEYNSELGKQDQITSVTTGLKGNDAKAMTDQVRAIAQTYNVDFREAINAANTLMTQFGLDGQKSLNLLKKGMQGMIQGDGGKMLSMIQQYAPAFRDAGIEADQLVAIIHNTEGGLFTDQNMASIVMGIKNIRLLKDETKKAMRELQIDVDAMEKGLQDGSLSVFDALRMVSDAIEETGSGSQAAGKIMQAVFGRQGTMAGTKLGEAIANLNLNLDETSRQTGNVGTAMSELEEATERLNTQMRDTFGYDGWEEMEMGLKTKLLNAITNIMVAIEGVENAIGSVMSAFATLSEYIGSSTIVSIFVGIKNSIESAIGPLATAVDLAWQLVTALSSVPDVNVPTAGGGAIGDGLNAALNWGKGMIKQIQSGSSGGNGGNGGGHSGSGKPKPTRTPKPKKVATPKKTTTTKNEGTEDYWSNLFDFDKTTLSNLKLGQDAISGMVAELQKMPTTKTPFDYITEGAGALSARIDEIKDKLKNGDLGFAEYQRLSEELKNLEAYDLRNAKQKVMVLGDNKSGLEKMIGSNSYQGAKAASEGLGQLASGLKGMGIELGEGFDKTISVMQSIFTAIEAVQAIISAVEIFTKVNDATQTAILSEIAFNTAMAAAGSFIPGLSNGGLLHAADGVFVPGAYNGGRDTVRALLSPGELVLNAAQQSNVATQLQANAQQRNDNLGVRVRGEDMYTAIDNYMRRTGKRFLA